MRSGIDSRLVAWFYILLTVLTFVFRLGWGEPRHFKSAWNCEFQVPEAAIDLFRRGEWLHRFFFPFWATKVTVNPHNLPIEPRSGLLLLKVISEEKVVDERSGEAVRIFESASTCDHAGRVTVNLHPTSTDSFTVAHEFAHAIWGDCELPRWGFEWPPLQGINPFLVQFENVVLDICGIMNEFLVTTFWWLLVCRGRTIWRFLTKRDHEGQRVSLFSGTSS